MATEEQAQGNSTESATGNTGATPGDSPKTETYTQADLQRESDRRVSEAQKKWKEQLDTAIADKTKDAEAKLAELSKATEAAQKYATFLEGATTAGIRNVKAAYMVATGGDYLKRDGRLDIDKFQKDNPEFFAPHPNANAGAGAGTPTNSANAFNSWLRG